MERLIILQTDKELSTVNGHLQPPRETHRFIVHCLYKHKPLTAAAAHFTHSNQQHKSPSPLTFCVAPA